MSNIIKTTQGEASFRLREEFVDQDKAGKGKDPLDSEVIIDELKIENIKYKLKEVLTGEVPEDKKDWFVGNNLNDKIYTGSLDEIKDKLKKDEDGR